MLKTFKGGMHIPDHKDETNKISIRKIDGAPVHIFPLLQHIGAVLEPKVSVGDLVKIGDLLADSAAFVSVPVHASISGTVIDIKPYFHPSGNKVTAIFVENDFKYEISDKIKPYDLNSMSKEEILAAIRNSGVTGMGGAGFPTHIKLSPPKDKKITHIIVNAAECEPYLTSDHRRLLEQGEKVLKGLKICLSLFDLPKGFVGIEANKPDAIKALKALNDEKVEIVPLKTKYPQGSEKHLIKAVSGRAVPLGALPADVGAIVMNVDTAYQIAETFETGLPLVSRIITVAGDAVKEPCNLEVRLGTPFEFVIQNAGGFSKEPKKVLNGGPMMGIAQYTLDVPTIKTTSAILAFTETEKVYDPNMSCIRCGKCTAHCPMRLMPLYLSKYSKENNLEMCEKYHITDCIECGLCSYQCPAMQGLVQNIRIGKQKVLEQRRKKQ